MNGNWVVITGASRGLGLHLVNCFWDAGWSIALTARNYQVLEEVAHSLPERTNQSKMVFQCDLSSERDVDKLVNNLNANLPRLNALINNAATHGPIGPLVSNSMVSWREALQVNLFAPVSICRGTVGLMSRSGGGSIINISGGGATSPRANFTAYASSKVALVRFSETFALEVGANNIRVNCISPGTMKTSLLEEIIKCGSDISGEHEFSAAKKILAEGGGTMGEVGALALFLAGNTSSAISGKLISAIWDRWRAWPDHIDELLASDVYTLRRMTARDRGMDWGDL